MLILGFFFCLGVGRYIEYEEKSAIRIISQSSSPETKCRRISVINFTLSKYVLMIYNKQREQRAKYIRAKYEFLMFSSASSSNDASILQKLEQMPAHVEHSESKSNVAMVEFAGVVIVHVIGGKNLPAADINGKSDPYVQISNGIQTVKTSVVLENLSPFWDEELQMNVKNLNSSLQITVLDSDLVGKDDKLAQFVSPLTELSKVSSGTWIEQKHYLSKETNSYIKIRIKFINLS